MNLRVILFLLAVVVLILCVTGAKIKNKNMQKLIKCSVPLVLFTALILCMSKNVEPYCSAPTAAITTFNTLSPASKENVNKKSPLNENNMGFGPTNLAGVAGYETILSNWVGSDCSGTSEYWIGDETTAASSNVGFKTGINAEPSTTATCRDACGQVSERDKEGDRSEYYELNATDDNGRPTNAAECILAVGGDSNDIFTEANFGRFAVLRDYGRFTSDGVTVLDPDQGRVMLDHICDKMDGAPSEENRRCLGLDLTPGEEGYEKSCPGLWQAFVNAVADETPPVPGCTDSLADNFDITLGANIDDGSCIFTCSSTGYVCTGAAGARDDANICEDPMGTPTSSCTDDMCCTQPRTCDIGDPSNPGSPYPCPSGSMLISAAPCVDSLTGSAALCNVNMCCNTGPLVPTLEIELVDKIVYNSGSGVYESTVDSTISNLPFQEELNVFKVFVVLPDDRSDYENMTKFTTESEFKFPEIIPPDRKLSTTFVNLAIPPGYPPESNFITAEAENPSVYTALASTVALQPYPPPPSPGGVLPTPDEAEGILRSYSYESYVTITNTVTELDSAAAEFPMKFDYQPIPYTSSAITSVFANELYPNTTSINIQATRSGGTLQDILSHNPGTSEATGEVTYPLGTRSDNLMNTPTTPLLVSTSGAPVPRRILVAQLVMPASATPMGDKQIKFTAGGNVAFTSGGGGEWRQTLDSEEGGTPISLTNRFDGMATTTPWYMG